MTAAVFAVVSWCGRGAISLYSQEHHAREALALMSARKCGPGCTREHRLIKLGEVLE